MKWSRNKIITLVVLFCIGAIAYYLWSILFFRVSGVTPRGKTLSNLTPYVDVNFNKKLGKNTTSQVSGTEGLIKSVDFADKRIRINFRPLEKNKHYTINLLNITSDSGDILSKSYSFTSKEIDYEKLPGDQKKVQLENQDRERGASDPILANLPYGGEHFSLSVSPTNTNGNSSVHLTAELLLSRADLSDEATAITAYKQEVADYIQSIGLRVKDYDITYETIEPSVY